MREFITDGPLLVVDDVWTTGGSMERFIKDLPVERSRRALKAVLMARGPIPHTVKALFYMNKGMWQV